MKIREMYDDLFFDSFDDVAQASARLVVPLVLQRVPAESVIDVGCGRGYWLEEFRRVGVRDVFGIDGGKVDADRLVIAPGEFASVDLLTVIEGKPLNVSSHGRFDLAVCMEVAEHLPAVAAHHFARSLTALAPVVLFSAAIPRQGGMGHLNEQWPSYWASLFARSGYVPVDGLRQQIWSNPNIGIWYRQNLLIYVDGSRLIDYPVLAGDVLDDPTSLDLVHPEYYEAQFADRRSVRDLVGAIPRVALRSMEARGRRLMSRRSPTVHFVE
jgi:SAM-dependent methyltransferase